jgi:hypothetical protein
VFLITEKSDHSQVNISYVWKKQQRNPLQSNPKAHKGAKHDANKDSCLSTEEIQWLGWCIMIAITIYLGW